MRTPRFVSVAPAGVVVVVLVMGCGSREAAPTLPRPAPALQIADWIKGDPVNLADGKGKTVYVVEFWATWCPPCAASVPHLSKLQRRFADRGVVVIGITNESAQVVNTWLSENPDIQMDYTVAQDQGFNTMTAYAGKDGSIPHAFLIDRTGMIVWHGHPMGQLESRLARMLAEEQARTAPVRPAAMRVAQRNS